MNKEKINATKLPADSNKELEESEKRINNLLDGIGDWEKLIELLYKIINNKIKNFDFNHADWMDIKDTDVRDKSKEVISDILKLLKEKQENEILIEQLNLLVAALQEGKIDTFQVKQETILNQEILTLLQNIKAEIINSSNNANNNNLNNIDFSVITNELKVATSNLKTNEVKLIYIIQILENLENNKDNLELKQIQETLNNLNESFNLIDFKTTLAVTANNLKTNEDKLIKISAILAKLEETRNTFEDNLTLEFQKISDSLNNLNHHIKFQETLEQTKKELERKEKALRDKETELESTKAKVKELEHNKKVLQDKETELEGTKEKLVELERKEKALRDEKTELESHKEKLEQLNNLIFKQDEIILVKDFINNTLRDLIVEQIDNHFPNSNINFERDCRIKINNLKDTDLLEGQDLKVEVEIFENKTVKAILTFEFQVEYQYDEKMQLKLLNDTLRPAIPDGLWNSHATGKYDILIDSETTFSKVGQDTMQVIPLPWLLAEEYLPVKIAIEAIATNYWSCFFAGWWGEEITVIGAWPEYNVIPTWNVSGPNGSNFIKMQSLFSHNRGYFNEIFNIIEKRLNGLGINCSVRKKAIVNKDNLFLGIGMGNLNFYNSIAEQTNKTFDPTKRQFFIQVSFDVILANKQVIEYPGVVFTISDLLTLYK
ncbi:hypothetical protein [Spiroplasma melliferum]|uniref:Uncharacterized protein n=2 Tax=Spiroplasma melliferum TaxID=2134 RepID=A0AAI9X145_SPIME|nr:hypothetical protein [Spiroplasma melliferum]KAI92560.1 hypothetical protein SPM_000315 [Spiroplasma melliferum KC3]QCO24147.1 hypothetical protein SRED_002631 [Spiroplasma melliferum]